MPIQIWDLFSNTSYCNNSRHTTRIYYCPDRNEAFVAVVHEYVKFPGQDGIGETIKQFQSRTAAWERYELKRDALDAEHRARDKALKESKEDPGYSERFRAYCVWNDEVFRPAKDELRKQCRPRTGGRQYAFLSGGEYYRPLNCQNSRWSYPAHKRYSACGNLCGDLVRDDEGNHVLLPIKLGEPGSGEWLSLADLKAAHTPSWKGYKGTWKKRASITAEQAYALLMAPDYPQETAGNVHAIAVARKGLANHCPRHGGNMDGMLGDYTSGYWEVNPDPDPDEDRRVWRDGHLWVDADSEPPLIEWITWICLHPDDRPAPHQPRRNQ